MKSMPSPRSLQLRLATAFTFSLLIGLCIFAALTFVILHRLEAQELDSELLSSAQAVATLVEIQNDRLTVEDSDRRQFASITGLRSNAAVIDTMQRLVLSNATTISPVLKAQQTTHETVFRTFGMGDDRFRVVVLPITAARRVLGYAIVWRPLETLSNYQKLAILAAAITIALICIPAAITGLFIARRGLAPIENIVHVTSEIAAHNLAQRLAIPTRAADEVRELSNVINLMLDRLETAFERQRRFISDASHELRTPLTIILAEAELALRAQRTAAEYRTTVVTVSDVGREMQTLISTMLLAARAEQELEEKHELVDLVVVIHHAIERFSASASLRSVRLEYNGLDSWKGSYPQAAVMQLIYAIVDNALKNVENNGHIFFDTSEDDSSFILRIRDDGPGFTESALQFAQDRFWCDDQSRNSAGFGLGLSLAKALLGSINATLHLSNAAVGGAVVTMKFPRR